MRVSIIMPVLNQLELTRICVESLIRNTWDVEHEIIVIDNASTDGTKKYLAEKKLNFISNPENAGVARSWNMGISGSAGEYVCVINNDIVASEGWLSSLLDFYERNYDAGIVSPGTRWGEMDYDFEKYAAQYVKTMRGAVKEGYAGWCMLIKKDRFEKAGMFCEDYRIGTFEDTDFYLSLKKSGFNSYITGCSFVHHFGSRTLKVLRKEAPGFEDENWEKFSKKWGVKKDTYAQRKMKSLAKFAENAFMKATCGHTLDERRPK